jgi:hypothetical protein
MDRRLIFPQFQKATGEYDRKYFDNMVNMLNVLMTALRNPGEGRQSTLILTNLPSNDAGLEPGAIFVVNGVLRVPLVYSPYAAGVSSTGYVGTVTVTTA